MVVGVALGVVVGVAEGVVAAGTALAAGAPELNAEATAAVAATAPPMTIICSGVKVLTKSVAC